MGPFAYQPLGESGRDIRVLTLKLGSWDAPIECEIRVASLDDAIYYQALSYTWGNDADPQRITLNGLDHTITPNLEAALRHLRQEDRDRLLWIDQLCINQDDLQERAEQVELMGDIYRRATITISWLGEASKDSDEALEQIRSMGNWVQENDYAIAEGDHGDLPGDGSIETTTDFIEWLGFPLRSQNWSAICKLLERPYWTRVWIIQELAVRGSILKASGIICCGKKEIQRFQYDHFCALVLYTIVGGRYIHIADQQLDEPARTIISHSHPPGLTMSQNLAGCTQGDFM